MSIDYRDQGTLKVGADPLFLDWCYTQQARRRFFHAYPCSADSLVWGPGIETFSPVSMENNETLATCPFPQNQD
jgi:hypothetical protein